MKLFFGKSAAQPQVSPTDAIMKNKEAIETLTKRQDFLEKRVAQQDGLAREKAKAKDKRGAMTALKQKKMLSTELESLSQARLTLEQQIMTLESYANTFCFNVCRILKSVSCSDLPLAVNLELLENESSKSLR